MRFKLYLSPLLSTAIFCVFLLPLKYLLCLQFSYCCMVEKNKYCWIIKKSFTIRVSSVGIHLGVFPCGWASELRLRLSLTACCLGCGDASRCFTKMDKQRGPVLAYLPHSSSGVMLICGRLLFPIRLICRLALLLTLFRLLLLCRRGARLQSTLRAASQGHQFLRPARTSAGKTPCG